MLLKRVRNKEGTAEEAESETIGLGFNKMKVEIRAKASDKAYNPHRLEGNVDQRDYRYKEEKHESEERDHKRHKKHKKEKKEKHRDRERSE